MEDAGRDQRYDPIPLRRRLRVDQAGKAQPLEGAERGGDMATLFSRMYQANQYK